ncbi:hypothetical protein AMTRI_Chr05g66740 [Amborella trichopoda]
MTDLVVFILQWETNEKRTTQQVNSIKYHPFVFI